MKRRYLIPLLGILALVSLPPGARAGQISDQFREYLLDVPHDTRVGAIVTLSERLNTRELDPVLTAAGADRATRHETVVRALRQTALSSQGPLLAFLERERRAETVFDYRPFWITNAVAVECLPRVLFELESRFDVGAITPDEALHLVEPVERGGALLPGRGEIEPGVRAINAHYLWAQGITGQGSLACNFDSGVDVEHPALGDRWRGWDPDVTYEEAWFDPVTQTEIPFDDSHHGTHTMGTMVGNDPATGDSVGVAPEAKWIAAGVIDRVDIETTIQDALAAFEWAADPDGDPGTVDDVPDVVSNSWGISPIFHDVPECDQTFWDAIDATEAAGVVVVFSAGNEGGYGSMTLRTPANRVTSDVNAFSVGGLLEDQMNIAPFSSRGPSQCDSITVKPEVVAQGANVRSALAGGGYITLSGTSMACPHVGGAVLLLRQVAPDATADEVKEALLLSAVDLGPDGEDNDYGTGRIDVYEAAQLLGDFAVVEGYVYDAVSGDPLDATIDLSETQLRTTTDEDGYYSMNLVPGRTASLEVRAFGYQSLTAEVELEPGGSYLIDFPLEPLPAGSLEGYVTSSMQPAIQGARVRVLGTPVPDELTDATGFYRFESLPSDTYFVIEAVARGFEPMRTSIVLTEGETTSLHFSLSSGFFDDMEGDDLGWSHYSVTPDYGDEWHVSDQRNHTDGGTFSWKCGDEGGGSYSDHLDAALETPAVYLEGNKEMLVWHWMDIEVFNDALAWDGAVFEMRLDGGQWNLIEPEDVGYPYVIHPNSGSPFPSGMPVLSGRRGWELLRFDLRDVEGEARFRFRLGTDGNASKEGWYIDDVMLIDWRFLEVAATAPEDSLVSTGDTLRFGAMVQNLSAEEVTFLGRVDVLACGDFRMTLLGPREITLPPYGRLALPNLGIPVPDWAPPMTLTMELYTSTVDGDVIETDSFVFTIMNNGTEDYYASPGNFSWLSHLELLEFD